MAGELTVEIVTPESALFAGTATALVARSSDGEFTILAQHTALVGDIVPGVVRVSSAEGEQSFLVHGGFFQVASDADGTKATVLAGIAERVSDIDVARAQAAKEAAEAALAQRGEDQNDAAEASARAALARAELRLSVAS